MPNFRRRPNPFTPALVLMLGLASAIGARADTPVPVVASFSIHGDLARQVGGQAGRRDHPGRARPGLTWT
jgi:hypothetical protein